MRTLFLLRHAKSSWDNPSLRDFDRPLAERGRRAAPAMGQYMRREGLVPELVLCSTARRAQETWALMESALEPRPEVTHTDLLYGASAGGMLDEVRAHGGAAPTVMLVGHNPGMEDLAVALAGSGSERLLRRLRRKYPTAALAIIDFDMPTWSDVRPGAGTLRRFVRPKDLA